MPTHFITGTTSSIAEDVELSRLARPRRHAVLRVTPPPRCETIF